MKRLSHLVWNLSWHASGGSLGSVASYMPCSLYLAGGYRSRYCTTSWMQWRTEGGGGFKHPLPKSRRPSKIVPNSTQLWKLLKIAEFRTPTPQDVRKKGSKILKLPSVRNCFILAMTNKLVVIINSLKVPKIKKILLYEMKFLVLNYSCLQNPWLGGYRPQIPVLSVLNWICWTPSEKKNPGYATGWTYPRASVDSSVCSRLESSGVFLWIVVKLWDTMKGSEFPNRLSVNELSGRGTVLCESGKSSVLRWW